MRSAFTVCSSGAGASYVGIRKSERFHRSGFPPICPRTLPEDYEGFSSSVCCQPERVQALTSLPRDRSQPRDNQARSPGVYFIALRYYIAWRFLFGSIPAIPEDRTPLGRHPRGGGRVTSKLQPEGSLPGFRARAQCPGGHQLRRLRLQRKTKLSNPRRDLKDPCSGPQLLEGAPVSGSGWQPLLRSVTVQAHDNPLKPEGLKLVILSLPHQMISMPFCSRLCSVQLERSLGIIACVDEYYSLISPIGKESAPIRGRSSIPGASCLEPVA